MSDQNAYPSYQVHLNQDNNGSNLIDPRYLPLAYSKYVSVVCASLPNTMYNIYGATYEEQMRLTFGYYLWNDPYTMRFINYVIPNGNYGISDLVQVLRMTKTVNGGLVNFWTEYDPITGKVLIFWKTVSQFTNFFLVKTSLSTMLGFNPDEEYYGGLSYVYRGARFNYLDSSSFVGSISGTTLTITEVRKGTVSIGQRITNVDGVDEDTYITGLNSGTGGKGTYFVNLVQSVSSREMTASVLRASSSNRHDAGDVFFATPSYPCDLNKYRNIFVKTNFQIQSETSRQILAKIPVNVPFGQVIQYVNPNGFRGKVLLDELLTYVEVSFMDESGNPIDFNGAKWSLTLQFDFAKPDGVPVVLNQADEVLQPDLMPDDGKQPDKLLYGQ